MQAPHHAVQRGGSCSAASPRRRCVQGCRATSLPCGQQALGSAAVFRRQACVLTVAQAPVDDRCRVGRGARDGAGCGEGQAVRDSDGRVGREQQRDGSDSAAAAGNAPCELQALADGSHVQPHSSCGVAVSQLCRCPIRRGVHGGKEAPEQPGRNPSGRAEASELTQQPVERPQLSAHPREGARAARVPRSALLDAQAACHAGAQAHHGLSLCSSSDAGRGSILRNVADTVEQISRLRLDRSNGLRGSSFDACEGVCRRLSCRRRSTQEGADVAVDAQYKGRQQLDGLHSRDGRSVVWWGLRGDTLRHPP